LLLNEDEFFKDMEHSIIIKRNPCPTKGELVVIENNLLRLAPGCGNRPQRITPFTSIVSMEKQESSKRKILEVYWKNNYSSNSMRRK